MIFGWKKKVERLRVTILSAGHQIAKELPPGLARVMELFRQVARTGHGSMLQEAIDQISSDAEKPLWEPIEVHGWKIQATLYRDNGQLWWLLHAVRKNERPPSENDSKVLDKVLDHLGADPRRDMIIGPSSSPAGKPALPFGWWSWFNQMPLYEVQVKGKGSNATMRIVPFETAVSEGYERIDLTVKTRSRDGSE